MPDSCLDKLSAPIREVLGPWVEDVEVKTLGQSIRLEKQGLVMDLDDLGEGENGDYDPDDPEDTPLLRFSFYARPTGAGDKDGELMEIRDSSYCTLIDARLDFETRLACALVVFRNIQQVVGPYPDEYAQGAKRACEEMSAMCVQLLGPLGEAMEAAKAHGSLEENLPKAPEAGRKMRVRV